MATQTNQNEEVEEARLNEEDLTEDNGKSKDKKEDQPSIFARIVLAFLVGAIAGFLLGASYFSPNKESAPQTTYEGWITQTPQNNTGTTITQSTQLYEVQYGDCWASIAQQFKTSIEQLLLMNPQKQSAPQFDASGNPYLYVGEIINVPMS